jgi:hypothetical protein
MIAQGKLAQASAALGKVGNPTPKRRRRDTNLPEKHGIENKKFKFYILDKHNNINSDICRNH